MLRDLVHAEITFKERALRGRKVVQRPGAGLGEECHCVDRRIE